MVSSLNFEAWPHSMRGVAVEILCRYERRQGALREVLARSLTKTPGSLDHPGTIRDLVAGVVKYRPTLDWMLGMMLRERSLAALPLPIRNILRVGAYELLMTELNPEPAASAVEGPTPGPPAYAVVHEAVEVAKGVSHPGLAGLVNGALRHLARRAASLPWPNVEAQPVKALALRYAHPEWLIERWLTRLGREETEALCRTNNTPAPFTVRVNTLLTTRDAVVRDLRQSDCDVTPTRWSPCGITFTRPPELTGLSAFQQGLLTVQDEASQLVSHLVAARSGAFVIDACAAPGGKTTHLAELMNGRLLAVDQSEGRLRLVHEQAKRLGLDGIETLTADARTLGERFPQEADALLLDAPCSGLGILRRRPELRWQKRPTDITGHFPRLQEELLHGVAAAVKVGGALVYAVCSDEPEETDQQIIQFLHRHPDFSLVHASGLLPNGAAELTDRVGSFRTWPHRDGMDGFFAARFIRERAWATAAGRPAEAVVRGGFWDEC